MSETGPRPALSKPPPWQSALRRSKRGPTVHYEPSSGRVNVKCRVEAIGAAGAGVMGPTSAG